MKQYLNLPKDIYFICLGIIVTNLGAYVYPLLTLISNSVFGLSASIIGVILTAYAVISIIGNIIGGILNDKHGRKKIFFTFMFSSGMMFFIAGLIPISNYTIILVFLGLGMFLSSIAMPASGAMIADLTTGEKRKAAFSLQYLSINIGFAIGPLIGTMLLRINISLLFFGDGITTMLFAMLILLFVRETLPSKEHVQLATDKEVADDASFIKALWKRPALIIFSIIIALFFIVFKQFSFGLPLFMVDIYGNDLGTIRYGLLMTVNGISVILLTPLILHLTKDKLSSLNIFIGGLFYIVGFGAYAIVTQFPIIFLLTILWTLGEILIATYTSIYIADHSPITHRGRFNSIFSIVRKVGTIASLIPAGIIIDKLGLTNMWLTMGSVALVSTVLMFRLYISDKRVTKLKNVKN